MKTNFAPGMHKAEHWFGHASLATKYAYAIHRLSQVITNGSRIVFGSALAATFLAGFIRLLYDRRKLVFANYCISIGHLTPELG
jgi:hypothetical protein